MAQTILGKIKDSLKSQKKYTTLEVIAAALTAEAYGKDTVNQKTVTFKTFKLGADFKKVDSAPFDYKLYLVARTMLLDGKQVTISIKEKDGIIKGTADAVLPVLEITEEQMAQKTPAGQAVPGTEKTVFTGTVKDNMVKIPIHLRPKSEEELKQWKDKISKGKEDGTYTYTFGSATNIDNETKKTSIAKIILDNAKKGNAKNPKIENGKSSSEEEIKKALAIKNYQAGDTITFKLLKKVPEFLYLHAKAQGEKQYDKKFLNKEGAYFQIGRGKCPRCSALTSEEIKGVFPSLSDENIIEEMIDSFNKYCEDFKVNTCTLKAHFFAQAKQESGDRLTPAFKGETMDYTVAGLKNTGFMNVSSGYLFGRKTGIQMAEELGRPTSNSPGLTLEQQIKVANFVYGLDPKAATLGNKAPANNQSLSENDNEGWRYRGRGMLQITGKDNYTKIEKHVNEVLKSNVLNIKDGRRNSEIFTLTEALLTGLGDWHMHKMYVPAEAGVTKEACLGVIKIINSATKSKTKRIAHLIGGTWYENDDERKRSFDIDFKDSMAAIFRVSECNQEETSIEEACTEDCSQCFNYADVWENPEISNDNGGKNNNRFGFNSSRGHKGIDIVSGPQYKDVHSLMCGEVTAVVNSFKTNEYRSKSLGNTLMVKSKGKNGQTVFILYCHLDKIYVKKGDKVRHGQKVALSGSTGNASSDEFPNGVRGKGINKKFWHVHIEAATRGDGANNFLNLGSYRIKAEDYMKTKFDNNGNPIK